VNIEGLSLNGLKLLHGAIRGALADDDAIKQGPKIYGAREYPDWRETADRIEAELEKRDETFDPLPW
jgi:hypothetical protein